MPSARRGLLFLATLPALCTWSALGAPAGSRTAGWEISGARVVSPGRTVAQPEGTLTAGYVVEARARPLAGARLPHGSFRMEMTAFRPERDLPGQRAGVWHVNGQWSLIDDRASPAAMAARHSPSKVQGRLLGELVFNPASEHGLFSAAVKLPATPVAGRLIRGGGVFSGNSRFEGTLVLDERAAPAIENLTGSQP